MSQNSEGAGGINIGTEAVKGLIAKLSQAIIGFAGTIVFARILGPTSFGGFYFLLSIVILSTRVSNGVGIALGKRYSEEEADSNQILGTLLISLVIICIIATGLLLLFGDYLSRRANVDNAVLVAFLLFTSISTFLVTQKIVGASGRPAAQIWYDTLRSVLTLPLQLLFVMMSFGAAGMGYGLAAATLAVVPVGIALIRVRPAIPSRGTILSVWGYARYSIPSSLVGGAYGRFDVLVLGVFLGTGIAGQYEVAHKLTIPATHMTGAVTAALMPKISNLHSRDVDVGRDITNSLSYNSVLAIPMFFGALALSEQLVVTIYGPEYSPAAPLLIGLAFYQIASTQTGIYQTVLNGIDKPNVYMRIATLTLIFNLVIGILLLIYHGAIGVVIATILSEMLRLVLSANAVSRYISNINLFPRPLFEQFLAAIVMYIAVRAGLEIIPVRSWVELVVLVSIGALTYFLSLMVVSPNSRATINSLYNEFI